MKHRPFRTSQVSLSRRVALGIGAILIVVTAITAGGPDPRLEGPAFTYYPNRQCNDLMPPATCPTASAPIWQPLLCCDYCDAPKSERDCIDSGTGCNRGVWSSGPASCGFMKVCGTFLLDECKGGVVTASGCQRILCINSPS